MLASGPQRVSATFNEQLQTTFAAMTVVGPDGNVWSAGEPTVAGAMVSIALRPLGPSGTYTVNYRVTFRGRPRGVRVLVVPAHGVRHRHARAAGCRRRGGGGDVPVWPFVAAALALVAGGAWWAVRHRR